MIILILLVTNIITGFMLYQYDKHYGKYKNIEAMRLEANKAVGDFQKDILKIFDK